MERTGKMRDETPRTGVERGPGRLVSCVTSRGRCDSAIAPRAEQDGEVLCADSAAQIEVADARTAPGAEEPVAERS